MTALGPGKRKKLKQTKPLRKRAPTPRRTETLRPPAIRSAKVSAVEPTQTRFRTLKDLDLLQLARMIGVPVKVDPDDPDRNTDQVVTAASEERPPSSRSRGSRSLFSFFQAPNKRRSKKRPWYRRFLLLDRPFLILAIVLLAIWLVPVFADRIAALQATTR
tara:strand:- start:227 stop:709 length:483 start_codon:yes stop_codon:yes gene_type:complete